MGRDTLIMVVINLLGFGIISLVELRERRKAQTRDDG